MLFAGAESHGLNWLPYDNCTHIERTSVRAPCGRPGPFAAPCLANLAHTPDISGAALLFSLYQPQEPQIHPKLKLVFTFIHLQNLLQLGNLETSAIENLRGLIQTDRNENFNICPLTGGCPDGSDKRCDMEKCAIDDKQHLLPPGVDC